VGRKELEDIMAHYTVNHKCGHDQSYELFGPGRDRERKLTWLAGLLCAACKKEAAVQARDAETAKGKVAAEELGLPPLTGSEKQIAWAEAIRAPLAKQLEEYRTYVEGERPMPLYLEMTWPKMVGLQQQVTLRAIQEALSKNDAHWWIEHRGADAKMIINEVSAILATSVTATTTEEALAEQAAQELAKAQAAQARREAEEEATVRPANQISPLVAEISTLADYTVVLYPEKSESLRLLVKELGYRWDWDRSRWQVKKVNPDFVVETANKLMLKGFAVRVYAAELRRRATVGEYKPASKRNVRVFSEGTYAGWFALSWPREEDLYPKAKRLRGARYVRPALAVPPDNYLEVLDFAELHGFALSRGQSRRLRGGRPSGRDWSVTPPLGHPGAPRQRGWATAGTSSTQVPQGQRREDCSSGGHGVVGKRAYRPGVQSGYPSRQISDDGEGAIIYARRQN